jgi:hypothetical protein
LNPKRASEEKETVVDCFSEEGSSLFRKAQNGRYAVTASLIAHHKKYHIEWYFFFMD